jgi:hypothetical protein
MAIETLQKRTLEATRFESSAPERVIVGLHMETGHLTFSGGEQGNAVIVADPPMLILRASADMTRFFSVEFRVETPGFEFPPPPDGAFRFPVGKNDAGFQVPRDAPKQTTLTIFNGLKGDEHNLTNFEVGLQPVQLLATDQGALQATATTWHDPSILWDPPQG